MTEQEFEDKFINNALMDQYAIFIVTHHDPKKRRICNGGQLFKLMEENYLIDEFKQYMMINF